MVIHVINDPGSQNQLDNQDHRQADVELGVPGLVPEGVHAAQGTDTAANQGHGHQGGFRDAPKVFLGFLLVNQHKQKTCRIDYKEVSK